jgi:hypothetical protein
MCVAFMSVFTCIDREDMWIVKLQQLRFFIDKISNFCGKTVGKQVPLQWQCVVSCVFLLSNCLDHFDDSK